MFLNISTEKRNNQINNRKERETDFRTKKSALFLYTSKTV